MIVAVLDKGKIVPSKYDYGSNQRVTFENLGDGPAYVYLNLTDSQMSRQHMVEWLDVLQPGNVLEVSVDKDSKLVNKFAKFKLIRKVGENEPNTSKTS